MHLHLDLPCIGNYRLIHGNYGRNSCILGRIQQGFDDRQVVVIDDGI